MGSFNEAIVEAAVARLGQPFQDHFIPDICNDGTLTLPECWERGLGQGENPRYDCSGLIIACACDALDISLDDWPRDLRHGRQMAAHADSTKIAEAGDIIIIQSPENSRLKHVAIYTGELGMLHVDRNVKKVSQGSISTWAVPSVLPVPALVNQHS